MAERGPRAPDENVISYNSAISTCEKRQHVGAHCTAERQCNVAERGPRAPGQAPCLSGTIEHEEFQKMTSDVDDDDSGTISYNSTISACEKDQQSQSNSFFDYGALGDDDEFVGVPDRDDEVNEEESLQIVMKTMTTDVELQEMIDEANRDGEGEVNEEEILRIMEEKTALRAPRPSAMPALRACSR